MTSALYNRDILRLAAAIPHQHRLASPDASVELRSPICGSRVVVDVVLNPAGQVVGIGQEVRACALGQASASLMSAAVLGRTAADLDRARAALAFFLAGESDNPGDWPGLAVFAEARPFTARHKSILLPFEAASAAAKAAAEKAAS